MARSLATWARRNDINVYVRNAGPTLRGLLERASEASSVSINLDDEVDLARALAMRACEYLSIAIDTPNASDETRMLAERTVREAIRTVVDTVSAAAKVKLLNEGAITLSSVGWVIAQIAKVIDDEVRVVDAEMADAIVKRIEEIKLPVDGAMEPFVKRLSDESFM
jgi:hypothetical protein